MDKLDLIDRQKVLQVVNETMNEVEKGLQYQGCKKLNRTIVQNGFKFILKKLEEK